jgi:hypothetical protein
MSRSLSSMAVLCQKSAMAAVIGLGMCSSCPFGRGYRFPGLCALSRVYKLAGKALFVNLFCHPELFVLSLSKHRTGEV